MIGRSLLAILVLLAAFMAVPAVVNPGDRKIIKEPSYVHRPRYCLVTFGDDKKLRVWLVLDGEALHVDANGNGNLTEPGESLAEPTCRNTDNDGEETRWYSEVPVGNGKYKVTVGVSGANRRFRVSASGPRYSYQWAGSDKDGELQFAQAASLAPVIHFDGPMTLVDPDGPLTELARGPQGDRLSVRPGTPGAGRGTFAYYNPFNLGLDAADTPPRPYEGVPVAEIEFPSKKPGAPPVRIKVDLSSVC